MGAPWDVAMVPSWDCFYQSVSQAFPFLPGQSMLLVLSPLSPTHPDTCLLAWWVRLRES